MIFFAVIGVVLIFSIYKYVTTAFNEIKLKNNELIQQANVLNAQLDIVSEKEFKTRRDADIAILGKEKLMSSISHEIRTPMNGIYGMSTLLASTELDNEQREYVDAVIECSKILLHNVNEILIDNMLSFSKLETESLATENKSFSIRICVEEVIDMFAGRASGAGTELLYEIDNSVPLEINGDYKKLQQVLINLVENALKFTSGGEVFIHVSVFSQLPDHQLVIGFIISDTGQGIPENKLEHIFDVLLPEDYSTKNKEIHTGFGLVICKRLIEEMNGKIEVKNNPVKGCCFTFSILANSLKQPTPVFINNVIQAFEGKQVLIVDDNETSLSILTRQMEKFKLSPLTATSGGQALEMLSQFSTDVIITDLSMPGMDGIGLSQLIATKYPQMPVILLNDLKDDRYKQFPEIFSSVINKPVREKLLADSLVACFKQRDTLTGNDSPKMDSGFSKKYPLNILVAEDNPVNQKWIKKILVKTGYEIDIAENGKVVMEKVSNEQYDLILMDVQMPEMDGLEATRMIRLCLDRQPVIIAMTANAMQGDRDQCIQSGMNDYISKPVELNILLAMLEKWSLIIKDKKQLAV
jgi:CheY-like chemotaxis protein/signal transduction histidine kinase